MQRLCHGKHAGQVITIGVLVEKNPKRGVRSACTGLYEFWADTDVTVRFGVTNRCPAPGPRSLIFEIARPSYPAAKRRLLCGIAVVSVAGSSRAIRRPAIPKANMTGSAALPSEVT